MKKTLLCLLSCFWIAVSAEASPIGKQKAQAIAHSFLTEKGVKVDCLKSSAEGLATPADDGSRPFYVFNNGSNKGFVIVSGDDRAPKILGYSCTGSFQEENIPENLSAWLGGYASEVQMLKQNTRIQSRLRKTETQLARNSISPLVTTHWNQYAPYFNLTPKKNGQQCVTGCVATAFAQVMKYYEWPKEATVPMEQGEGENKEVILPSIVFNWEKMLNDYQGGLNASDPCNDGEEYQLAVAQLMLYCGKSVHASYGTGETSASSSFIPGAMKNYFRYQGNIVEVNRSNYSSAEWDEMIYNELYNGRPVIYSGRNASSGHAFVCDGYGEDGYFHINWGWGGMSDGYYLLSILEPGAQGAGGSNAGYNMNQSAIVGIQPGASTEVEAPKPCLSIMSFEVEDYESSNGPQGFRIKHWLQSLVDGDKQYNAQLLKNGEVIYEGNPESMPLDAGYHYTSPTTSSFFTSQTLADGTYDVRLVCRMVEEGKENEWLPCDGSEKYLNQITIEGNKVISSNTIVTPVITCSGFTTSSTIYVSNKTSGVAHLSNDGGLYYQGKIYLWLDGTLVANDMAYIDAGKNYDLSLTFTPTQIGTLPVKITTDSNGENVVYNGTITVVEEDENANYELKLTDWSIDNLDKESGKICGGAVSGTLTITNTGNKTYSGRIGVGFSSGGSRSMSTPSTIYTLAAGESVTLVYSVDEEDITINNYYSLDCYENGSWGGYIGSTESYQLIAGGYTYWTADGTPKSKAEESNDISIVTDAVAVKFFSTPTGKITPNNNSNTLYYLSESSAPESLSGKNVILNGKANEVTFADGSNFYVPLGFTAQKATYTRVPTLGANGSSGWETILLPFPVQKVMNQTDNKQIYWFVSRDDDGKDFWLKSFSATDGETVFFDFVDEIRANVPYIIATPGNKWGEEYDLRGKTMAFIAEGVKVPESSKFKAMTDDIKFVGVSSQQNVTGYVLDEIGKYFVMKEDAPLKAFRAFFTVDDTAPVASAPRLKIDSYQTDDITDITGVADGEADVYSLDGIKVGTVSVSQGKAVINHLPQGVYIVNGKKIQRQ